MKVDARCTKTQAMHANAQTDSDARYERYRKVDAGGRITPQVEAAMSGRTHAMYFTGPQ